MIRQFKKIAASLLNRFIEYKSNSFSEKREKSLLQNIGQIRAISGGGDSTDYQHIWADYWAPVVKYKSKWAYRLYSQFCGDNKYILSQPIADALNRAMNPSELLPFYSDKNIFDKILPKGVLPQTIFRVMDGIMMDADYNIISEMSNDKLSSLLKPFHRIILKPTVDTSSGNGVRLFNLRDSSQPKISVDLIKKSGNDIIIQEALTQSDFMAQFNPTSINTIRIATYKSPYDGEVHILSAVIRMGAPGAYVDNLHKEGHMIRINEQTGTLAKQCFNADGIPSKTHGPIDFSNQSYTVPDWDRIISFAKLTASALPHLKLLQLDIAIDSDNNPRLIEFNASGFSMWIAQFTGTPALGEYTDEIRRYALAQKHSLKIIPTRH